MEENSDKAPELSVESENIRRSSKSASDSIPVQSPELSQEALSRKPGLAASKTTGDLQLEVKQESSIRRVDSDSKFGVMETISLDVSAQGALLLESGTEVCENPLMLRRPPEIDSKTEFDIQEALTPPETNVEDPSGPNSLSKYFSLPAVTTVGDPESIQFFDALAERPQLSLNDSELSQQMSETVLENKVTADASTANESDVGLTKETEASPPTLLKFFSEDKSGSDQTGKAFFDKIAAGSPSFNSALELNQSILPQSTESSKQLVSPALNVEIEEAWIPSEKTRQVLVSIVTSGNYTVDKSSLTFPEIIVDEKMGDPVKALLMECNSIEATQRKVLTENDVPEDEMGLKQLIEADCYHAAFNLTKKLLKNCHTPGDSNRPTNHTPLSLKFWYARLAILVKLRKFSYAEAESAPFGDFEKPDLYYEYYSDIYKGKRGTMVPFSFRLLLAELPQHQGNHQLALDNMYKILHVIQKMIKNVESGCAEDGSMIELSESRKAASLEIWKEREQRVLYSILNCVLAQKNYILASSVVKVLLKKSEEKAPQLLSALGRIYLQLGDVKSAQECFSKAAKHAYELSVQFEVEENINKALLAVALNNCEEAYNCYSQAYNLNPSNPMLVNNMAVCLLYMGRLKESLALLERTIQKNPVACLHDGIIFNICTLYELESSMCPQKKLAILELISKYAGDSFNVSCLKIQPVK